MQKSCLPSKNVFIKIFPLWLIKGLVYIKARRLYVVRMIIEEQIWVRLTMWLGILKKR